MSTTKAKPTKRGTSATHISKVVETAFPNEQDERPEYGYIKLTPTGRPTKYSATILAKTYTYINQCQDEFYNYQKGYGNTDTYERRVIPNLPTLVGLALFLNVHRDTLHEWSKHHPAFSDALALLSDAQQDRLINRSLSGDYNATIAKLILSSNHGMREKTDVTSDDKPLPQPIINVHRDNSNPED